MLIKREEIVSKFLNLVDCLFQVFLCALKMGIQQQEALFPTNAMHIFLQTTGFPTPVDEICETLIFNEKKSNNPVGSALLFCTTKKTSPFAKKSALIHTLNKS